MADQKTERTFSEYPSFWGALDGINMAKLRDALIAVDDADLELLSSVERTQIFNMVYMAKRSHPIAVGDVYIRNGLEQDDIDPYKGCDLVVAITDMHVWTREWGYPRSMGQLHGIKRFKQDHLFVGVVGDTEFKDEDHGA